ncbi:MAG TPA: hypothetical protein VG184_10975 [Acidimicrobiales bacterium]|nr:hypothetical protein [Acidimicrobiales bacterium]
MTTTDATREAPGPTHGDPAGSVEVDAGDGAGGDPDHDSADAGPSRPPAGPAPKESWRRRSAAGVILTGFALGLQEALESRREEPAIMMETSGDPPTDLPVEADVGQIRAADNVVTIRPWLLSQDGGPGRPDAGTGDGAGAPGDPTEEPPRR